MNCHKTEKAHKLQTTNYKLQTTNKQTMCFRIPFFCFFKKTNIVGDDDGGGDDDDGSLASLPSLVDRSLSDLVFDDDDVVNWDVDCVVKVDSTHFFYHVKDSLMNQPRPPFGRYRAMLKREKERNLDMEFLEKFTPRKVLVNRKKEEDRCNRILDLHSNDEDEDDRDDHAAFNVGASGALVDRALAPVVDGLVPLPFGAVRFPIPTVSSTKGSRERDPLSYFNKDTLRIAKKALQEQVDQKKVELRNLGMDIPNDQTIFEGLNVGESYGFMNAAINKASKQKGCGF